MAPLRSLPRTRAGVFSEPSEQMSGEDVTLASPGALANVPLHPALGTKLPGRPFPRGLSTFKLPNRSHNDLYGGLLSSCMGFYLFVCVFVC